MTDADWLRLLAEKSPREFTPDELAALREQVRQSPEVREAVRETLQLEQTLTAGLANVDLPVEELLERALQRDREPVGRGRPGWWTWIGLTASLGLLVGAALWFQPQLVPPRPLPIADQPDERTDADLEKPLPDETQPAAITETDHAPATESPVVAVDVGAQSETTLANNPVEPWAEWLRPESQPLPPDSPRLMGDLRTMGHDELSLAEFRRWWSDVPQQRAGVSQDQIGNRRTVHVQGWVRLHAPWLTDTQLRLTPFDVRELTLFFWTGDTGVALRFYRNREPHLWAAFQVHRQPGETNPDRWGLLTTDSGAFSHSGAATLEVAVTSGRLVLSTGQNPVLSVPLSEQPTDVLLSAESRFRGFSWLRVSPREHLSPSLVPPLFGEQPVSAWPWQTDQATEAMLQRDPDGGVTLTGSSKQAISRVYVPLDQPGLFQTLIQVAAADPGTGVYLGDRDGKPLGQLGFFRDRRSSQTTFGFLRPDDRRTESDFDDRSQPPPYLVPQAWLRVVAGLGVWNTWVSGDGQHWGHTLENPVRDLVGSVRSVGLYCLPSDTPRTIRLQKLEVRPLTAVDALADPQRLAELSESVETWPRTFDDWLRLAWERKPADVDAQAWCNTVAVAALHQGPPRDLSQALLGRLADSAQSRDQSAAERLRLLDEVLLLTDHWQEHESSRWARQYAAVRGLSAEDSWSRVLSAPLWTHRFDRRGFQQLMADQLVEQSQRASWTEVRSAARRALFWTGQGHPDHQPRDGAETLDRLARWARGHAAEALGVAGEGIEEALPVSWRHPAQLPLNKEAYNVRAELQAALSTGAYRDAGRIVTALSHREALGLLPDVREPGLQVSLPIALESSLADHPEFAAVMRTEFAELGRLRVAQAQSEGNTDAVAAVALQFLGTAAGSQAERWLGDQQMAIGDFLAAGSHYRRALRWTDDSQRDDLSARAELARRLTGPLPGGRDDEPPSSTGATRLAGFDVLSLSAMPETTLLPAPVHPGELQPAPLPRQRYRLETRDRFDGQAGQNAGRGEYRDTDPFGRQFAIAVDARRIYINNRFQVTAYDRQSGHRLWTSAVGGEPGDAHAHRFAAMTPVVVGEQVFVRRVMKSAIELAGLDAATGQTTWTFQPGPTVSVLSDPVWAAGRLFAVVAHEQDQEQWDLRWTRFDPSSGRVLTEASVLRVRNAWDRELPCQLAVRGTQVVAATGGVTLSFDLEGAVHWVRREQWMPPRIDPLQHDHFVLPPVLTQQAAYVAQPNVRSIHCLDRATGRTRWSRPLPQLQGLLAVQGSQAFVAERESLVAVDAASGEILWRTALPGWLGPLAVDEDSVMVLRRITRRGNRGWVVLTWLDTLTGEVIADSPLEAEEKDEWRCGPWFTVGSEIWTLVGEGAKNPHRDLVTLKPLADGGLTTGPWHDPRLGPWFSPVSAEDRHAVQTVLPGWQPLWNGREGLEYSSADVRGERHVLKSRVGRGRSLSFARTVALREDAMPVLQLRVGREGDGGWTLVVRADDQIVHEQQIDAETARDGWCDVHLPLGAFLGQTVLLQVQQVSQRDQSSQALWKSLDVISE
jgi:outer membrane protein assembly factor BamB